MDHAVSQEYIDSVIEHTLPNLPGWCTPEKGKRLSVLARGAYFCVELGVFGARSLISIALALRESSFDFARIDGIDPYTPAAALEGVNAPENNEWWSKLDYEAIAREAQTAIYRLGLVQYAHLIRMRSCDVVDFYADGTLDLLHQDANHSEETSCEEVVRWAPKIRPGGIWIADDTNWESTQKAQRELVALGFMETENHETWKVYRKT